LNCPENPDNKIVQCFGAQMSKMQSFKRILKQILVVRTPESENLANVLDFVWNSFKELEAGVF
jgi:hypothetical protein